MRHFQRAGRAARARCSASRQTSLRRRADGELAPPARLAIRIPLADILPPPPHEIARLRWR